MHAPTRGGGRGPLPPPLPLCRRHDGEGGSGVGALAVAVWHFRFFFPRAVPLQLARCALQHVAASCKFASQHPVALIRYPRTPFVRRVTRPRRALARSGCGCHRTKPADLPPDSPSPFPHRLPRACCPILLEKRRNFEPTDFFLLVPPNRMQAVTSQLPAANTIHSVAHAPCHPHRTHITHTNKHAHTRHGGSPLMLPLADRTCGHTHSSVFVWPS